MSLEATPTPTSAEVSALRTQLYEAQQELAAARAAKAQNIKAEAIRGAVAGYKLSPGSEEQIAKLIDDEVILRPDERGVVQAAGPGLTPLGQYVGQKLATDPTWAKFRATDSPAPPSAADLPAGPDGRVGVADWIMAHGKHRAAVAAAADPRTHMSAPFGLRPAPR